MWLAKDRGRLRMQAVLTAGGAREDSRALEEAGGLDSLLARRRWTARGSQGGVDSPCGAREGSRALEDAGGVDSRRSARRLAGA